MTQRELVIHAGQLVAKRSDGRGKKRLFVPALRLLLAVACIVMLSCLGAVSSYTEKRVALVIGNSSYRATIPLPNPRNDATDMAVALQGVGFETILATDLDKRGMDDAFRRFARLARDAEAALFFYAGHGMQFGGANYLMPVDAKLQDEADLPYELARVDDVIADLSRAKNTRIVILDACRDNPLAERLRMKLPVSRSAAISRGLARIEGSQGLITAFATQPGQLAADGVGRRNSPFTAALLKHIATPGIEAGTLFRRVAQEVNQSTGGKQLPELSVSLLGEFYFAGQGQGVALSDPDAAARHDYELAAQVATKEGWDAFLARHSTGYYADLARVQRGKLAAVPATVAPTPPLEAIPKPDTSKPLDDTKALFSTILGSTEVGWNKIFAQAGKAYQAPVLVLYRRNTDTKCGAVNSALYYCPADQKIYLESVLFEQIMTRCGKSCQFSQAYMIAHEVGHHVQNLIGILHKVQEVQRGLDQVEANQLQVRVELQADCLAGVWANHAEEKWRHIELGDVEAAMQTASAIVADRLQRHTQVYVVPDALTHGSSEQRTRWFMTGLKSGQVASCDTFQAARL